MDMRTRLAQRRVTAGHSQESLAALLGVDRTTVGRWERGITVPQPWVRSGLAEALDVSQNELAELLTPGADVNSTAVGQCSPGGIGDGDWVDAAVSAMRQLLDVYDLPEDGPIRPLDELQHAVAKLVSWRLNSAYSAIAECLPVLAPELTRGLFLHEGAMRSAFARLLVQAYRAADAVADKFGFHDLSARIIHVMGWAATESDDPLAMAAASYVRAQTFFVTGQLETGRRVLERAADQLTAGSSMATSAAYGALHMRAAVTAARTGLADHARDHVSEAYGVARTVPDGVYTGTAFGPSSVRIHEVTMALDLQDISNAMATAAGWVPPTTIPAERRSHFYVDLARAQVMAERPESALEALHTARSIAPEHIHSHPQAQQVLAQLSVQTSVNNRPLESTSVL